MSYDTIHRRNEERAQGVPWAPPIRSKMGPIRSKIGEIRTKIGPFWGVVFHENTSCKSKFRSKGAELFWAPQILWLNLVYARISFNFEPTF